MSAVTDVVGGIAKSTATTIIYTRRGLDENGRPKIFRRLRARWLRWQKPGKFGKRR